MGLFDKIRIVFSHDDKKGNAEEEGPRERREISSRNNPCEGTRVLVIDDSHTVIVVLKRFLESSGCVVLEALDAKAGLQLALTQKPDLIFLDIVMPGINGFAALRALRKNVNTRSIPVIMMSGNEQATAQFFGINIGADDFMKKPFSRTEVFARIERLLDKDGVPRRLQEAQADAMPSPEVVSHANDPAAMQFVPAPEPAPLPDPVPVPELLPVSVPALEIAAPEEAPFPSINSAVITSATGISLHDLPPAAPVSIKQAAFAPAAPVQEFSAVQMERKIVAAAPAAAPWRPPAELLTQIVRWATLAISDPSAMQQLAPRMRQVLEQMDAQSAPQEAARHAEAPTSVYTSARR
ncbi:MAG: response regulator [Zoogloeaceae bacterium]|jgi:twitching motility two-component system response regulator PilH|nr:response regulator [Zoogloeaceae bacterium]